MPKAAKPKQPKSTASKKPNNASKAAATAKNRATEATENAAVINQTSPAIESYLLQVRLINSDDPTITRLLVVPSNFTFAKLHQVLQVAFGWASCHAHSFDVSKILKDGEIPNFMNGKGKSVLTLLPDTFMTDAYPDPEQIKKEADFTLADVYGSEEYGGKVEVSYEYDHGDSWLHDITFLGRADPSLRKVVGVPDDLEAFCLGGEGHPAAEDCGSSPGWENLKSVFKKGKRDPEGLKDWYKHSCANGDSKGLDPYKWDMMDVNDGLASIKA